MSADGPETDSIERAAKRARLQAQENLETEAAEAAARKEARNDLYLDTINRAALDFDFEKLCSVSLSHVNVYACLVCGKYFQGRGKSSHAYFHSIDEEHHVFINLETAKVYVLPDGYPVDDPSLDDVKHVLNPIFTEAQIHRLDAPDLPPSYDLGSKPYLPGFIGLNNISSNDYLNVVIQALVHVKPLRDYFIRGGPPGSCDPSFLGATELVKRFASLTRKMWNPRNFKSQVSPHEFLQEVVHASGRRFEITKQGDPCEFLGWLLNRLHQDLGGTKKKNSSIIYSCFQGEVRIETQQIIIRSDLTEEEQAAMDAKAAAEGTINKFDIDREIKVSKSPFLFLALDLPPPPVFQDVVEKNIIPQVPLSAVLAKYDGMTTEEKQGQLRRYKVTRMPPYLILWVRRFTSNRFVEEKNPTIVNFPIKGVDMAPYAEGVPMLPSAYDLVANITVETRAGTVRENTVWRAQTHTRIDGETASGSGVKDNAEERTKASETEMGTHDEGKQEEEIRKAEEKWFQMQDLIVEEINKQMIFLGESYIQIWERRDGGAEQVERALGRRARQAGENRG